MNHLQNFGKIIDLKKYHLGDFCQILTDQKNVYQMISVQCRRDK